METWVKNISDVSAVQLNAPLIDSNAATLEPKLH